MFEPTRNIRKKPLPTSSQSSSISHSTTDSYAMINKSQLSEDNITSSRSRALQYQASLKKLTYTTRPSKSETTSTSNKSNKSKHSFTYATPPTARKQPLKKQITSAKEEKVEQEPRNDLQEEEEDEDDLTFSKLKSTFMDVVDSSTTSIESKDDFIDTIKSQMDAQTIRIRRLERALKEKDDQLIKGDNESTISLLLARYPHAMDLFQKRIEQDHYDHQIAICIDQFEDQKARMLEEYQRNFDMLKMKYRSRFDDIVERMISDPSRLDDEWARRVQKDADDRVEEFKRKMMGSSNSHRRVYNQQ